MGDLTTAAAVLRPDYATGPALGASLEVLEDTASCARHGIVIRDPSAFRRLAEVDLIVFDDHPALAWTRLEVDSPVAERGETGDDVLRYAATAYRDLAGEHARALRAGCEDRGLAPFDVTLEHDETGITFRHAGRRITVENQAAYDTRSRTSVPPPLVVRADGREIGRLAFRRASRPEAAAVLQELRRHSSLPVGLLLGRPEPEAAAVGGDSWCRLPPRGPDVDARVDVLRSYRGRGFKSLTWGIVGATCRSPARPTCRSRWPVVRTPSPIRPRS